MIKVVWLKNNGTPYPKKDKSIILIDNERILLGIGIPQHGQKSAFSDI